MIASTLLKVALGFLGYVVFVTTAVRAEARQDYVQRTLAPAFPSSAIIVAPSD